MNTLSAYRIEHELLELIEARDVAEQDGDAEAVAAMDQQIAAYLDLADEKIDSFAYLIIKREDDAAACEARIEDLRVKATRLRDSAARLKSFAMEFIRRIGRPLKSKEFTMRVQGNGGIEPLEVTDMAKIQDTYKRITVTMPLEAWKSLVEDTWAAGEITSKGRIEVDGTLIRQCLKHGVKVDGAKLLDRGFHLRLS